jgi:hypothetical protein
MNTIILKARQTGRTQAMREEMERCKDPIYFMRTYGVMEYYHNPKVETIDIDYEEVKDKQLNL